MTIATIKQTLESNLSQNLNLLEGVPTSAAGIVQFLADLHGPLEINASNVAITAPNASSLNVAINLDKSWQVQGVAIGQVDNGNIILTITENGGSSDIALEMTGTFAVSNLNRTFPVKGTLSDPKSWDLNLDIGTSDLPNLNDLMSMNGLSGLGNNLDSMGISLPTVTQVSFGYNFRR